MAIKAITFDLWDVLVHDDSDEAERARLGLRSKRDERRHLLWEALNGERETAFEDVVLAYDTADAASNLSWKQFQITWTLLQRLNVVLDGLHRGLPDAVLDSLPPERRLRIPMVKGSRSLNLSNTVSVAVYEAWRQLEFAE